MITPISLAPLLERFFTQRLMQQRQASPHTISSYRDTFRQFLKFIEQRLRKPPSRLTFEEIDAPLIVAFLDDLEKRQGLSVRSRNLRLTAIHSFFRYAAFEAPAIPHRSSGCSPSPANASPAPWSSSSLVPKSMPCLPLRISSLGLVGAITPFCLWRCRRACAYRK